MHTPLWALLALLSLQPASPEALHLNSGAAEDPRPLRAQNLEPSRVRSALRAMLELEDGQLDALLTEAAAVSRPPLSSLLLLTEGLASSGRQEAEAQRSTARPRRRDRRGRKKDAPPSDSLMEALKDITDRLEGDPSKETKRGRRSHHLFRHFTRAQNCNASQKYLCPSPDDVTGEWRCIDDHQFCDGTLDCPNYEDEQPTQCFFYKSIRDQAQNLEDAILSLYRKI